MWSPSTGGVLRLRHARMTLDALTKVERWGPRLRLAIELCEKAPWPGTDDAWTRLYSDKWWVLPSLSASSFLPPP